MFSLIFSPIEQSGWHPEKEIITVIMKLGNELAVQDPAQLQIAAACDFLC